MYFGQEFDSPHLHQLYKQALVIKLIASAFLHYLLFILELAAIILILQGVNAATGIHTKKPSTNA